MIRLTLTEWQALNDRMLRRLLLLALATVGSAALAQLAMPWSLIGSALGIVFGVAVVFTSLRWLAMRGRVEIVAPDGAVPLPEHSRP